MNGVLLDVAGPSAANELALRRVHGHSMSPNAHSSMHSSARGWHATATPDLRENPRGDPPSTQSISASVSATILSTSNVARGSPLTELAATRRRHTSHAGLSACAARTAMSSGSDRLRGSRPAAHPSGTRRGLGPARVSTSRSGETRRPGDTPRERLPAAESCLTAPYAAPAERSFRLDSSRATTQPATAGHRVVSELRIASGSRSFVGSAQVQPHLHDGESTPYR
jgi:hypothetical protein